MMVLDPVTAFGFASNVFQIIEFTLDLFDSANEIYQSSSGLTQGNTDLEGIARQLSELCTRINMDNPEVCGYSSKVVEAAKSCEVEANKVLEAIKKLGAKSPRTKWKSFTRALKSLWRKKKIEALKTQMRNNREMLMMELIVIIRCVLISRLLDIVVLSTNSDTGKSKTRCLKSSEIYITASIF
jgi:N-terminal domain on NACHT_NTPase and P-loop NTPases